MAWGAAAPWIISGAGALANYFSNRAEGEDVAGFGEGAWGSDEGLHPELAMAKALANVENLGGIFTERAAQPISLPGAFVQPLPSYYGGGLPGVIGPQALDPALIRPGAHLTRPGTRFPEPELEVSGGEPRVKDYWGPSARGQAQGVSSAQELASLRDQYGAQSRQHLFPGAARTVQPHELPGYDPTAPQGLPYLEGGGTGAQQPPPSSPAVGGGFQEIANALKYLGVEQDPFGNLVMGKDYPYFADKTGTAYEPRIEDPTPRDAWQDIDFDEQGRNSLIGGTWAFDPIDPSQGISNDPTPQAGFWNPEYGLGPSSSPTGTPGAHSEVGGSVMGNPGLAIQRRKRALPPIPQININA